MSDWLTFLWFVDTCILGHSMRGPQEVPWDMVKNDFNKLGLY
jgi:hypothetical protein